MSAAMPDHNDMLAGIRARDLTTIVVGPVVTSRLADYAAEIIKLELARQDRQALCP